MKRQYAIAAAWVVGMLFAPDNLILLGNSAGSIGVGIIFLLIFVMCFYILYSRCYKNIAALGQGPAGEFEWISDTLGPAAAVVFSIAARVLAAVFLATATLVASGYVFNEVFVQRFPNFAFAFFGAGYTAGGRPLQPGTFRKNTALSKRYGRYRHICSFDDRHFPMVQGK